LADPDARALALAGSVASGAAKDGLRVEQVETRLVDDMLLHGRLAGLPFQPEALEALENGVR
jgi:hypothetical protein